MMMGGEHISLTLTLLHMVASFVVDDNDDDNDDYDDEYDDDDDDHDEGDDNDDDDWCKVHCLLLLTGSAHLKKAMSASAAKLHTTTSALSPSSSSTPSLSSSTSLLSSSFS